MSEESKTSTEEAVNAATGNWDEDFKKEEKAATNNGERPNYKKIPFMSFPKPGKYQVRLVGKHVKFLKHWQPLSETVKYPIITHPTFKGQDPAWKAGFYPSERYAIHVIDRADGQVKVLEQGKALFSKFAEYKEVNQVSPASTQNGPDFVITVEWSGGLKSSAKYSATATAKITPLTEEEMAKVSAARIVLEERYKTTPLSKIIELWNSLPEEKKIKKERENKTAPATAPAPQRRTEVIAENMPEAQAEKDDMFGDDGAEGEDKAF